MKNNFPPVLKSMLKQLKPISIYTLGASILLVGMPFSVKPESSKVLSKEVIGIGLLLNDLGEVLIDQRTNDQSMAGMWEFPGGKLE